MPARGRLPQNATFKKDPIFGAGTFFHGIHGRNRSKSRVLLSGLRRAAGFRSGPAMNVVANAIGTVRRDAAFTSDEPSF